MNARELLNSYLRKYEEMYRKHLFIMKRTKSNRVKKKVDLKIQLASAMIKNIQDILYERDKTGIDNT